MAGATARSRDAILEALENLTADELKKFKMKLGTVALPQGYGRIPRGQLERMDAVDLTDKLVCFYTVSAAQLTGQVLRDMGMQDVAEQLLGALPPAAGTDAPPTASGRPPLQTAAEPGQHFVDRHRSALINRVTCVDALLDALYGPVLSEEQYQAVRAEGTNPEKMRKLYSFAPAWNRACKDRLLTALRNSQPYLVEDLES